MRETGEGDVRTKRDKVWRRKFKQEHQKKNGFNTRLFPGSPLPQY
jgi:hypothetical protein